jgi:hypothetical protein
VAEGARDQESSSAISDATSRRADERAGAEVARMASAAAGDGGPGARWSAWRGGGIMTGESRPGERSSGAGSAPAAVRCFVDGAGAAAAGGRGSEGAEASGVKKPTWRILGSTPPDEERGGRRRSIAADGEGLGWGLRWDTRASDSRRAGGRGWRLETGELEMGDRFCRIGLGWAGPARVRFFFKKSFQHSSTIITHVLVFVRKINLATVRAERPN